MQNNPIPIHQIAHDLAIEYVRKNAQAGQAAMTYANAYKLAYDQIISTLMKR